MINDICEEAFNNAKSKGFYDEPQDLPRELCLIHSEVSEALEALRDDKKHRGEIDEVLSIKESQVFKNVFEENVKGTFEDELGDIVLRVFSLAGSSGIDLQAHIISKMRYNTLRENKHGGKKF